MNNRYELISVQPIPPPSLSSPPPILDWLALISVILAGVGYFGRVVLEQWKHREQSETALQRLVIDHLLKVQSQLIADSKEMKFEILRHIDLKESVSKMATLVEEKVNRALAGQSELYIESLKNQGVIISEVKALHTRGDDLEEMLKQFLENRQ